MLLDLNFALLDQHGYPPETDLCWGRLPVPFIGGIISTGTVLSVIATSRWDTLKSESQDNLAEI